MGVPQLEVLDPVSPFAENSGLTCGSSLPMGDVPLGCPCANLDMPLSVSGQDKSSANSVGAEGTPPAPPSKNEKTELSIKIENKIAEAARDFYTARLAADDLASYTRDPHLKDIAILGGKYANDLDFFFRKLALVLDMPISTSAPFLPFANQSAANSNPFHNPDDANEASVGILGVIGVMVMALFKNKDSNGECDSKIAFTKETIGNFI